MGIEDKIDLESEGEMEAVKIQDIPIPKDEKELVDYFRNMRDTREFGVQLVMYLTDNQPDYGKVTQLCTREERQKIGYLSELALTLKKYGTLRQETVRNLRRLSETLQDSYQNWIHLSKDISDLTRRLIEMDRKTKLNHKWKVYPGTYAEDILDWLDLYHDEYFQSREAKENVDRFYEQRGIHRLKL